MDRAKTVTTREQDFHLHVETDYTITLDLPLIMAHDRRSRYNKLPDLNFLLPSDVSSNSLLQTTNKYDDVRNYGSEGSCFDAIAKYRTSCLRKLYRATIVF